MKKIICVIFLLISFRAIAQETGIVTGIVTDEKGDTLPGATVFLTGSAHSATTGSNGHYSLSNIAPGSYELVVKMIGYLPYVHKVVAGNTALTVNAALKEDNVMLATVTVKGTDPNRGSYIKTFTRYFIGESTDAGQCAIINPQVINFHYNKETEVLEASTQKLLVIENEALGYRINYLLTHFSYDAKTLLMSYTGYPYFEELKGSEAQRGRWERNRKTAYLGSSRHFFRSVINHTTEADGFFIYALTDKISRMKLPVMASVPASELFATTGTNAMLKPMYNLRSADDTTALYVFYKGGWEPRNFINSGIYLQSPVKLPGKGQLSKLEPLASKITIDKNGALSPVNGFFVSGYWAWEKMAELMPSDYGAAMNPATQLAQQEEEVAAKASHSPLEGIIKDYKQHGSYHATEKMYLQLNKPWYNRADTIWFKAYTVMEDNKPTDISSVAYAELIDGRDSVLQRLKLKLSAGMGEGDFTLPITYTPGTYHIRAYTNWMRNNDARYIYNRAVNIGGLPAASNSIANAGPADIQFFPEGGTLLNGVRSRIAFKATNPDGTAAQVKGIVMAEDGTEVGALQSGHQGMGDIYIMPQAGKSYHAVLQVNGRQTQTVGLPAAEGSGFSLAVTPKSNDSLMITIAADAWLLKKKEGCEFYLVITAGGKIVYTQSGSLLASSNAIYLDKRMLPSGLARITLFSETGEPVNERVVFIQSKDEMALAVHPDKNSYLAHGKVSLAVEAKTAAGKPALGNLSVSVINESLVPADEANEETIFSQLLLSSELHGGITDPGYYFANTDSKTVADLDLLMLTQGFRKLEWKKLTDTTNKPKYIAESGLDISGSVKAPDGKPVSRGKVSLFVPKQRIVVDTLTDEHGRFNFDGLNITGNSPVMVKATRGKNNTDVNVLMDASLPKLNFNISPKSDLLPVNAAVTAAMQKTYIRQDQEYPLIGPRAKARQLKEVTIKSTRPPKPDLSTSANLHGGGVANVVIMAKELGACINLSECLGGLLTGVKVYPNGKIYYLARGRKEMYYNATAKGMPEPNDSAYPGDPEPPGKAMAVFVDGGQINSQEINLINANDIYSIEVLTSVSLTSVYGQEGSAGVILITTKRGGNYETINEQRAPGIINYLFNGYYKERSFYTPKYSAVNTTWQDERSAVYWKADILAGNDGKFDISYNNAGKGNYRVVIEGIDDEGNIGRYVYRYKVQ